MTDTLEQTAGSIGTDAPPTEYFARFRIGSEEGPGRNYTIPNGMAEGGATLHEVFQYALGNEVTVSGVAYQAELTRGDRVFAESLSREVTNREYSMVLVGEDGNNEVHGDSVNYRSHGLPTGEPSQQRLPDTIVVGGRTLGNDRADYELK